MVAGLAVVASAVSGRMNLRSAVKVAGTIVALKALPDDIVIWPAVVLLPRTIWLLEVSTAKMFEPVAFWTANACVSFVVLTVIWLPLAERAWLAYIVLALASFMLVAPVPLK